MLKREGNTAGSFESIDAVLATGDWECGENSPVASLYVGTTGDLALVGKDGGDVIFKNAPVGFYPIDVLKVKQTGTTATDIIVLR